MCVHNVDTVRSLWLIAGVAICANDEYFVRMSQPSRHCLVSQQRTVFGLVTSHCDCDGRHSSR